MRGVSHFSRYSKGFFPVLSQQVSEQTRVVSGSVMMREELTRRGELWYNDPPLLGDQLHLKLMYSNSWKTQKHVVKDK